jgi:hypothetical protein
MLIVTQVAKHSRPNVAYIIKMLLQRKNMGFKRYVTWTTAFIYQF